MTQTPRFVILGPQGAGKGTQAGFLSRHFGIPHISLGDEIRAIVAGGTVRGRRLAKIINRGEMIPDTETNAIARLRLSKPDCRHGWIVDGYPRSMEQAVPFFRSSRPNIVLYLHFLDRQAIRRLSGRRVCPKGHIYHLRHDPPKKRRGYCDHDGLKLKQRDDDVPSAIRKRLRIFHHRTEPVVTWLRHKGLVVEVDASRSIPLVYRQVKRKLARLPWIASQLKKK